MALVRRVVVTAMAMAVPAVWPMMRLVTVTVMAMVMPAMMAMVHQCPEGEESRQRRDNIRIMMRFRWYAREGQRHQQHPRRDRRAKPVYCS